MNQFSDLYCILVCIFVPHPLIPIYSLCFPPSPPLPLSNQLQCDSFPDGEDASEVVVGSPVDFCHGLPLRSPGSDQ